MIHLYGTLGKDRRNTYDISFLGNGGEEQLTIVASAGQHGCFACAAIAVSVDGSMRILHQGDIPIKDFTTCMSNVCEVWLKGSTKTWYKGDLEKIAKYLRQMNKAIAYKFEVE